MNQKNQEQGNSYGNQNVKRGVHTEIEPRQGHQYTENDAADANGFLSIPTGKSAVQSHGCLGVSAGEGVAGCRLSGGFHDGKVGILYPRAGNTKGHFQKLVENGSRESGVEQIISLIFVNTPENDHAHCHKNGFLSEQRDDGEKEIQYGIADAFQEI